jgi:hypothetical protein
MTFILLFLYLTVGLVLGILFIKHEIEDCPSMREETGLLGMVIMASLTMWPAFVGIFGPCWLVGKAVTYILDKLER